MLTISFTSLASKLLFHIGKTLKTISLVTCNNTTTLHIHHTSVTIQTVLFQFSVSYVSVSLMVCWYSKPCLIRISWAALLVNIINHLVSCLISLWESEKFLLSTAAQDTEHWMLHWWDEAGDNNWVNVQTITTLDISISYDAAVFVNNTLSLLFQLHSTWSHG